MEPPPWRTLFNGGTLIAAGEIQRSGLANLFAVVSFISSAAMWLEKRFELFQLRLSIRCKQDMPCKKIKHYLFLFQNFKCESL
jgi:hypothetical protein